MKRRKFIASSAAALGGVALAGISMPSVAKIRFDKLHDYYSVLQGNRARQLKVLDAYIKAAKFPHNVGFPGGRIPYFVDYEGTPCAVAHLMIKDGWKKQVEAIAKQNNHVRVMDVVDGPIATWVKTAGVTQEEAALIQPSYDFFPNPKLIAAHLTKVKEQLIAETSTSTATALRRWSPLGGGRLTRGFVLVDKPTGVANITSRELTVFVNGGKAQVLGSGRDLLVQPTQNQPAFVEWTCHVKVADGALRVIHADRPNPMT